MHWISVSIITCVLVWFFCGICVAGVAFDFEDGTLQGWTVVYGDAGKLPVDKDDDRVGGNFGKQGKYFIGTYENHGDAAEVELVSPVFEITSGKLSLLVGGGSHKDSTYVALYSEADNSEIYRETGTNEEKMRRVIWDVSALKGKRVYLKIADRNRGDWGHINVDDIREVSPDEEAQLKAEELAKVAEQQRWLKSLLRTTKRKVYKGDELTDLAMPLGGIGAGNIAICGDGALREWQIFNKVNSSCVVPYQFFAIWAKSDRKQPVSRLLQLKPVEDLPTVQQIEFVGEYPIAEIRYKDPSLPVQVRAEVFSPFIPMNSKDSGIPAIIFEFRVKNPRNTRVSTSILASLQNAVNYDGLSKIEGVQFKGYGGNTNRVITDKNLTLVYMENPSLPKEERQYGTMALAALSDSATVSSQWDILPSLWADFARDGRLDNPCSTAASRDGRTWNGAMAVPLELRPGEERRVTFVIAWHFPNLYAEYDPNLSKYRLGRMYNNWFADSRAVVDYVRKNYGRLAGETRRFRDTFYDSTLPYWFINRILATASTLTSQTCLWIEDGSFHAFEGCGCCPMNCTHVWNYEQTLAHLFPDLERNMRHTDLKIQQMPSGAVRHRTILPLSLPRGNGPFVDGHLGTILKSYREYQLSADDSWLKDMWPNIKMAMDFVVREWDKNADGVLVNEQWNTYDAAMYGPNTFIGTLYLAALRAAEEMAKVMGDEESSKRYRSIFESGSKRLDSILWNGEYYVHIDSKAKAQQLTDSAWLLEDWPEENNAQNVNRPYGKGCHADQLLGQWWAHVLGLGYLLPKDRVGITLDSIMKYDWRWDFANVQQQRVFATAGDKGLLNCTWPHGDRPQNAILYADEVWTGIEYEVAGLMLCEGRITEAYEIVKAIDDRYNGVPRPKTFKRNPWNEIECGEHYARAMSSWALLRFAQGFSYRGPEKSIGFDPRIKPENHTSFFTTAKGWGSFRQHRSKAYQVNVIDLKYGELVIQRLGLRLPAGVQPKSTFAYVGKKSFAYDLEQEGDQVVLRFWEPLSLTAGQKLEIKFEW